MERKTLILNQAGKEVRLSNHRKSQAIEFGGLTLKLVEIEILSSISRGFVDNQISQKKSFTPGTIRNHLYYARKRNNAIPKTQMIATALEYGLLDQLAIDCLAILFEDL